MIVYATFRKPTDPLYWYATWSGTRWVSHLLTDGGGSISPRSIEYEYSGGIALDHQHPSNLYLSRQVSAGWQIERWSTHDGRAHWTHHVVVPATGTDNVRPVVAPGSDDGALLAPRRLQHVHHVPHLRAGRQARFPGSRLGGLPRRPRKLGGAFGDPLLV